MTSFFKKLSQKYPDKSNFKKKLMYVAAVSLIIAVSVHMISTRFIIAFAQHDCLPYKLYIIDKKVKPTRRGEYVCISGKGIPRYGAGKKLVKVIVGVPGDTVVVIEEREELYKDVKISGNLYRRKITAIVKIIDQHDGERSYEAYDRGRDGTPIPFLNEYGVKQIVNGYYVAGTHPASYDSRYFGVIDASSVIGKAHPVF